MWFLVMQQESNARRATTIAAGRPRRRPYESGRMSSYIHVDIHQGRGTGFKSRDVVLSP